MQYTVVIQGKNYCLCPKMNARNPKGNSEFVQDILEGFDSLVVENPGHELLCRLAIKIEISLTTPTRRKRSFTGCDNVSRNFGGCATRDDLPPPAPTRRPGRADFIRVQRRILGVERFGLETPQANVQQFTRFQIAYTSSYSPPLPGDPSSHRRAILVFFCCSYRQLFRMWRSFCAPVNADALRECLKRVSAANSAAFPGGVIHA
jgi:hypothetical protein